MAPSPLTVSVIRNDCPLHLFFSYNAVGWNWWTPYSQSCLLLCTPWPHHHLLLWRDWLYSGTLPPLPPAASKVYIYSYFFQFYYCFRFSTYTPVTPISGGFVEITKVMLCYDVEHKAMTDELNIWFSFDRFQQCSFHFFARNIFMMQNPVFAVTTFFAQFVITIRLFIKTCAPFYDFFNTLYTFFATISTTCLSQRPSPAINVSSMCFVNYRDQNPLPRRSHLVHTLYLFHRLSFCRV